MKANLSKRLVIGIGAPVAILFVAVIWMTSSRGYDLLLAETENVGRGMARFHAARFDAVLNRVSSVAEDLALTIESGAVATEELLEAHLRHLVEGRAEIFGSCAAFEPESFVPGKFYYAPYVHRQPAGGVAFVQLGNPEYNPYRWEWYWRPKSEDKPSWAEPYFDEGGGNVLMTTYSVPFRRDGVFWGIATVDLSLEQLIQEAKRIQVEAGGYAILTTRAGQLLAYPDEEKLTNTTLQDVNAELAKKMSYGEGGFMRTHDPIRKESAWIAYEPIVGGALMMAVVHPQAAVVSKAIRLQREVLFTGAVGLAAIFTTLFFVARSISRPISKLALAAQDLARGDFSSKIDVVARTSEVRELATAFHRMKRELQMRMEELRYSARIHERFEGELAAARSIQMSLLSKEFPAFPEREEIDIGAILKPAHAVGGDFYDFYFTEQDCLCLMVGDVAGKGVPAALFMAVSKTLLRSIAAKAESPAELFRRVNEELHAVGASGMFVSVSHAVLNVKTGAIHWCNAGHPPPLVISTDGRVRPLDGAHGVALGAWKTSTYVAERTQLEPGDVVIFYSDGVTDAKNSRNEFYSHERFQALLPQYAGASAQTIVQDIVNEVRSFSGANEQFDDITVMAVHWRGPHASST